MDDFVNELSVEELDCLFAEMESLGVFRVQLAGGEPLMRNDFLKITDKLKKYRVDMLKITIKNNINGILTY